MNHQPNQKNLGPRPGITPQQILQGLMRLDPQQRNNIIMKSPQLQLFLEQYEQHRKAALQQQAQNNQQQQKQQQQQQQQQQHQQMGGQQPNNAAIQMMMQQQAARNQRRQGSPVSQQSQPSLNSAFQNSLQMQMMGHMGNQQQQQQQQQPAQQFRHQQQINTPRNGPMFNPQQAGSPSVGSPRYPSGSGVSMPRNPSSMQQRPGSSIPPSKLLPTLHYWSDLFQRKAHDVPSTVKAYETIVQRDAAFEKSMQEEQKHPFDAEIGQRMIKDLKFYQQIRDSRLKAIGLRPELNGVTDRLWGDGYSGYGNGFSTGRTVIILPENRKKATTAPDIYISKEKIDQQAVTEPELVPIRLEFDQDRDGFQFSDTFMWDLNDKTISVEAFVDILMADFHFPADKMKECKQKFVESFHEQLSDYHPMIYPDFEKESNEDNEEEDSSDADNSSEKISIKNKQVDLRFPITLDITIGNNELTDRFDWDIMNPDNDPDEFAEVLCADMSLPGEFVTAVSHSIREQCQIYIKSLYLVGYRFDGSMVTGEELKEFMSPNLDKHNVIRPRYLLAEHTASLQELSYDNVEKLKKEREREARRKKRGQTRIGRRGGVLLPDLRDLPKTMRTPVPTTVLPGGANMGHYTDSYLQFPVAVDTPQRQLKAFEDYKKDQIRMREQERMDQMALQRKREEQKQQADKFIAEIRLKLHTSNPPHLKTTYHSDENKFMVKVKVVGLTQRLT